MGPKRESVVEACIDESTLLAALKEDVRKGLSARPRSLPPKYFYDQKGSRLFQEITTLPEYYLTRTEMGILRDRARLIAQTNRPTDFVELGPGDSRKSRILLEAMRRTGALQKYLPLDISVAALKKIAADLRREIPGLLVHGIAGEFDRALARVPPGDRRLVAFLGSTLGNFDRAGAISLLRRIARLLGPGDRFLLGVDLVKDTATLEAAYNDSAGVTARFNRNILAVINRRLGADFKPGRFEHLAFFNSRESRIEMHLRARKAHKVRIEELDMEIEFAAGETLHTENSTKYTRQTVSSMLGEAGLSLRRWFTDPGGSFALSLAARAS